MDFTEVLDDRYPIERRRSKTMRSIKPLELSDIRKYIKDEQDAFPNSEKLSCLEHDKDQPKHVLCSWLCSTVEECPWDLHAMLKHCSRLSDSCRGLSLPNSKGLHLLYLQYLQKQQWQESIIYSTISSKISAGAGELDVNYTDQRKFSHIHRHNQRRL